MTASNPAVFAFLLWSLAEKHIETRTDGRILYLLGTPQMPFSRTFQAVLDRYWDDLILYSSRDVDGLPRPLTCWMCEGANWIEDAPGQWRCVTCDVSEPADIQLPNHVRAAKEREALTAAGKERPIVAMVRTDEQRAAYAAKIEQRQGARR